VSILSNKVIYFLMLLYSLVFVGCTLWDMDEVWKRAWVGSGKCGECWRDPCICGCDGCAWKQTTAPDCTSSGEVTRTCTRNKIHNETIVVKALEHDWSGSWIEVDRVFIKTCMRINCNATQTRRANDEMVWINPGTFTMGSPESEANRYGNENQHKVNISKGFWMGKYEVTQEQYQAVTGFNPSNFTSNPATGEVQAKRPVECVTWYDAVEFCNKLSEQEGLTKAYIITGRTPATGYPIEDASVTVNWNANGYRLPTEAEWEYACRARTTTTYNTGNTISDNIGWYGNNSNSITHEAGKKPPNGWGLYDMHGNVWEWCWDRYGSYASGTQTNPRGAASGSDRVSRGGSWYSNGQNLRSAIRDYYNPSSWGNNYGFRLLRP